MRRILRKKNILFLAITVLVVLLDQATKAWILSTVRLYDSFAVIGGLFNITHVRNPGAAFGFLAAAPPLFLAGAVGNLIDRVRFGEVVDFLDVYIGSYHWPAFNVADSAITVGAAILIAVLLRRRKERTEGN